jgi:hypothetical protein
MKRPSKPQPVLHRGRCSLRVEGEYAAQPLTRRMRPRRQPVAVRGTARRPSSGCVGSQRPLPPSGRWRDRRGRSQAVSHCGRCSSRVEGEYAARPLTRQMQTGRRPVAVFETDRQPAESSPSAVLAGQHSGRTGDGVAVGLAARPTCRMGRLASPAIPSSHVRTTASGPP